MHLSDAVLESVMVFRLGAGAVAVAEVIYFVLDLTLNQRAVVHSENLKKYFCTIKYW